LIDVESMLRLARARRRKRTECHVFTYVWHLSVQCDTDYETG
jgi:hypothetical protein